MSNALAIATVTETLRNVLQDAVGASLVGGAQVTTLRPDDASLQGATITPGVNVFLYLVTPNIAWRNDDLPTRRSDGTLLRRPQVALDLHYLLSFYGADATLEQQRLVGAVARALHAAPTLDRATVHYTEGLPHDASGPQIYASNLSQQAELVRFTPINFSLEEMSKLWSVFLKTDYVLSLAYQASVVLIETDDPPPASALPVLKPVVQAVPFSPSAIDSVTPQAVALTMAGPNVITLQGQGLSGDTIAAFNTAGINEPILGTVAAGATAASATVILPPGLRPGVNTVRLIQSTPPASPPDGSLPVLTESNAAAFVLLPTIAHLDPVSSPGQIVVVVSPPVGPDQQVYLVLNETVASPPAAPQTFALPADPRTDATDTLTFSTVAPDQGQVSGSYLARLRVDTAESQLTAAASGLFDGPLVTVP